MRVLPPILPTLAGAALLTFGALPARAQDAAGKPITETDLTKMLETLESMSSKMRTRYHGRYREAVRAFQTAAATPITAYEFYLRCQKKTRFDDQGKLASAFKAWKDGEEDTHEDVRFRQALQMQLKYLILALKVGLAKTDEDHVKVIPALVSYLGDVAELDGRTFRWLDRSTEDTIFAETYELDRILILPDWESNPTEIGAVFESSILPFYRSEPRNPLLVSAWKSRLDLTKTLVEKNKEVAERRIRDRRREARRRGRDTDQFDPRRTADNTIQKDVMEEFMTIEYPELRWAMGKDLLENGFEREAFNGMLSVLRENEDHPNLLDWITDLTDTIKEKLGLNASAPGVGETVADPAEAE